MSDEKEDVVSRIDLILKELEKARKNSDKCNECGDEGDLQHADKHVDNARDDLGVVLKLVKKHMV